MNIEVQYDIEKLTCYVTGNLEEWEAALIARQIENDPILAMIVKGIELDLHNPENDESLTDFLYTSQENFQKILDAQIADQDKKTQNAWSFLLVTSNSMLWRLGYAASIVAILFVFYKVFNPPLQETIMGQLNEKSKAIISDATINNRSISYNLHYYNIKNDIGTPRYRKIVQLTFNMFSTDYNVRDWNISIQRFKPLPNYTPHRRLWFGSGIIDTSGIFDISKISENIALTYEFSEVKNDVYPNELKVPIKDFSSPQAFLSLEDVTPCQGSNMAFTNGSTGYQTYDWNFGNSGVDSIGQNENKIQTVELNSNLDFFNKNKSDNYVIFAAFSNDNKSITTSCCDQTTILWNMKGNRIYDKVTDFIAGTDNFSNNEKFEFLNHNDSRDKLKLRNFANSCWRNQFKSNIGNAELLIYTTKDSSHSKSNEISAMKQSLFINRISNLVNKDNEQHILLNNSKEYPKTEITGNTEFCNGESTRLALTSSFEQYYWSNGTINDTIYIPKPFILGVKVIFMDSTDHAVFDAQNRKSNLNNKPSIKRNRLLEN